MVRSIGADRVIDYTKEDFTRSASRYDLVADTAANHSISECRRVLSRTGRYVIVGGPWTGWMRLFAQLISAAVSSRFSKRKVLTLLARSKKEDLVALRELLETCKITPVIDRTYGLSDVPEAIRYLEEGHARGKVVVTLEGAREACSQCCQVERKSSDLTSPSPMKRRSPPIEEPRSYGSFRFTPTREKFS